MEKVLSIPIPKEIKVRLLKDMKMIEERAEFVEIQEVQHSYKQRCSKIHGFIY